jgi:hypothetical protein
LESDTRLLQHLRERHISFLIARTAPDSTARIASVSAPNSSKILCSISKDLPHAQLDRSSNAKLKADDLPLPAIAPIRSASRTALH